MTKNASLWVFDGVRWTKVSPDGDSSSSGSAPASHTHTTSDITNLAKVGITNDYRDLDNKPPAAPTKVSEITNDLGFVTRTDAILAAPVQSITAGAGIAVSNDGAGHYTVASTGGAGGTTGTVTSVSGTAPVTVKNGTTTPAISISEASTSATGVVQLASDADVTSGAANRAATAAQVKKVKDDLAAVPAQKQVDWTATAGITSIANKPTLAAVATSGKYSDLSGQPAIPTVPTKLSAFTNDSGFVTKAEAAAAAPVQTVLAGSNIRIDNDGAGHLTVNASTTPQVQSDWNATSGLGAILNRPALKTVATTGDFNDLVNRPSIPAAQVASDWNATSGLAQILNKPTLSKVAETGNYVDLNGAPTFSKVATTGSYSDLTGLPTIPAAQVQSDWNATTGLGRILNKPTLATVATSGSYNDLTSKPTIPTVVDASTSVKGIVQLADATAITAGTAGRAVTADQLKSVKDGAAPVSHTHTATQVTGLATVATTGKYMDLTGAPTIPTKVSELLNDSVYVDAAGAKAAAPIQKIIAGANVSISDDGAGGITVASTGTGGGGTSSGIASVSGTAPIQVADGTTAPKISVAEASSSALGVVKIADATAITAGTAKMMVDAAQLKAVKDGAAAAVHTHTAAQVTGLAKVATTGAWADISGGPSASVIPGYDLVATATAGSSTNYARADHTHTLPTAAQVGAAAVSHTHTTADVDGLKLLTSKGDLLTHNGSTVVRKTVGTNGQVLTVGSDGTVGWSTPAVVNASAVAPADLAGTAAVGVSTAYARADHVHQLPTPVQIGAAPTAHTHVAADVTGLSKVATSGEYADLIGTPTIPAASSAAAVDLAATAASGTASTFSRSDHVHKLPTLAQLGVTGVYALKAGDTFTGLVSINYATAQLIVGGTGNTTTTIRSTDGGSTTLNISSGSNTGQFNQNGTAFTFTNYATAGTIRFNQNGAGLTQFFVGGVKVLELSSTGAAITGNINATGSAHTFAAGSIQASAITGLAAAVAADFVNVTGDTMTGALTVSPAAGRAATFTASHSMGVQVTTTPQAGNSRADALGVSITGPDTGGINGLVISCLGKAANTTGIWANVQAQSTGVSVGVESGVTNTAGGAIGIRSAVVKGTGNWNFYAHGDANNYFAGPVGVLTLSPTAPLHIEGQKIRLANAKTPVSQTDTGDQGDICWDSSYLYVAISTNQWRRIPNTDWLNGYRTIPTETTAGTKGERCWDDTFEYRCVATNTWRRWRRFTWAETDVSGGGSVGTGTGSLWTATAVQNNPLKMIFAGGRFVGVTAGQSYRSSDGLSFTRSGALDASDTIAFANGTYAYVQHNDYSTSQKTTVYSSVDAAAWTARGEMVVANPLSMAGLYLGSANDRFVAFGHHEAGISDVALSTPVRIKYSLDAINWATGTVTGLSNNQLVQVRGVAWNGTVGVAVGEGGQVNGTGFAATNMALRTTDGMAWSAVTLPASLKWKSVVYGNGKFVAVGEGLTGAVSTDGTTWTAVNLAASATWTSVTFGNGWFVAVANASGEGCRSQDGSTWTKFTLPSVQNWSSVAFGMGRFVAVTGGNTAVAISE